MNVDSLHDFADRIEAAWKREKEETEADALTVGAVVATTEKSSTVGNSAAMRRTLERIDMMIVSINCVDGVQKRSIDNCRNLIKQALSAPPRNCDSLGGDEDKLFDCYIQERKASKYKDLFYDYGFWLLKTAKTKGENNGRK